MWYYTVDGQTLGPISEAELDSRVQSGGLSPATYIWRDGMANWQPYSAVRNPQPVGALRIGTPTQTPSAAPHVQPEPEPVVAAAPQGSVFESFSSWGTVAVILVAMFIFVGVLASRSITRDPIATNKPASQQHDGDEVIEAKVALNNGALTIRNNSSFDWPATLISFRSGSRQYFKKVPGLSREGSVSVKLSEFSGSGGTKFTSSTEPRDFLIRIEGYSNLRVRLDR